MLAVDRCSLAFWEGHVLNSGNYSAAIGMDFELRFGLDPLGKELTRWLTACQISQNFQFTTKMH